MPLQSSTSNTSRYNNEIIKQRLSCIPIFINDLEMPLADYELHLNINNDKEEIKIVTSADLKIFNKKSNKYLNDTDLHKIFPPDPITGDYITILKLKPKTSDDLAGDNIRLTADFSIATAKDNACFNVVSTCTYKATQDIDASEEKWSVKSSELKLQGIDDEKLKLIRADWNNLDAKRYIIPNSFDFKIETIGQFDNLTIVKTAIEIIINKLQKVAEKFSKQNYHIKEAESTIQNCFDVALENETATVGKILEATLYLNYYEKEELLTYCGFSKPHPHIDVVYIRLAFKEKKDIADASQLIKHSALIAIDIYKNILSQF